MSFGDVTLATLCNSERRLVRRWGPELGRAVARRLLDLAAVDADHIQRLPHAEVDTGSAGETTIRFGERIVIEGIITRASPRTMVNSDGDRMLVTRLAVDRETRS